jgi:hypothetical protein
VSLLPDDVRIWLRSLPLALASSLLLVAAAWMFFKGGDNIASIAAFASGLVLLGAWLATAIADWADGRHRVLEELEPPVEEDPVLP